MVKVVIEDVSEDVVNDLKRHAQAEGITLNEYLARALVRAAHAGHGN